MRCVIARFPFDLIKSEVEQSMSGITPEPVTNVSVTIGRHIYPVMQVGEVITRQNRRDFTVFEMRRALTRLGFTCHDTPPVAPTATPRAEDALGW
ncbi:SCO5918 family protein [Streptomyces cinerochromogenes]|uniref:SCO5918 family protein n=1 Tax=Streptomyces cinerochromogenes TaxID=66422 RepID=UPI0033AA56AB